MKQKLKMIVKNAKLQDLNFVVNFFDKYLDKNNPALYSREFFCPSGVKAAISKDLVILILDNDNLVAAVRLYPRKRDNIVSVYQFAISEKYRGNNLLKSMLNFTKYKTFEFVCPAEIKFNEYYEKLGAEIINKDKLNCWRLNI